MSLDRLEAELAEVCGVLNAAHARLVALVADALASDAWAQWGIHSPAHWLAWKSGLSPAHAGEVVRIAARSGELPVVFSKFEAGELSVDQVATVAKRVPAWADAQVAELAVACSVPQLRRIARSFATIEPVVPAAVEGAEPEDRCTTWCRDDDRFVLRAEGPIDQGKIVESALAEARDALFRGGHADVTAWDALVEVCERSLDSITSPQRRDRYRVFVHLPVDQGRPATFADGRAMSDAMRRYLSDDATTTPIWERDGLPFAVGRSQRTVPARTRRLVLQRDRGCRVPGCTNERWLDAHHLIHWDHGGPTDPDNLLALCPKHHRLHHTGHLHITGDPSRPDGLTFTNRHGLVLQPAARPRPPTAALPRSKRPYHHPTGERLDGRWIAWQPPPPAAA